MADKSQRERGPLCPVCRMWIAPGVSRYRLVENTYHAACLDSEFPALLGRRITPVADEPRSR